MAKQTTNLPKRTLLQLAHPYKQSCDIGGWFLSEKLDGIRMFWDGGATRGLPILEVPFANVLKQDRFVSEQKCTGLWTRYGHPVFAPDWWIDKLPNFMLDGEVWIARQHWQQTSSIVKRLANNRVDSNWLDVKYKIFDTPPLVKITMPGEINETAYVKIITPETNMWFQNLYKEKGCRVISPRQFQSQHVFLRQYLQINDVVSLHEQEQLPHQESAAKLVLKTRFDAFVAQGAEGVIVRAPHDEWSPVRSKYMLKVKQVNDAEARVIGYTSAEFGLTGAKLGLIGSLHVDYLGVKFQIGTGFTDEDRSFGNAESTRWAKANPGEFAPTFVKSTNFPIGSLITFKYSEFTKDGVPKEARYHRKAEVQVPKTTGIGYCPNPNTKE